MKPASRIVLVALLPSVVWGFWAAARGPEPASTQWVVEEQELLVLRSPSGFQTVSRRDGARTGLYYDAGELVGRLRPSAQRVVLLGLGGGEMLRAAWRSLPPGPGPTAKGAQLVGVELDAKTARLATEVFHLDRLGVEVVQADALDWVALQPKASVDVLMVDLYADSVLVPEARRLAFFADCARALAPVRGLLLYNVWPATLVPEVRRAMDVLFTVSERRYGQNVVLVAEVR